ncbi:unnamed protein product [Merluccius merluccius]
MEVLVNINESAPDCTAASPSDHHRLTTVQLMTPATGHSPLLPPCDLRPSDSYTAAAASSSYTPNLATDDQGRTAASEADIGSRASEL